MNALLPLLAASLLLSACHDNPLKAEDRPETIHFLVSASRFAESKTAFQDLKGAGYLQCMTHNTLQLNCEQFFEDMVNFARRKPLFQTLTVANLKDKAFFRQIETDYRRKQFDA